MTPHITARRFALRAAALLAAAALWGCAGDSKYASTPEYQRGYGDGCATGSARSRDLPGGVTRDANLYDANEAYRSGWRAGYMSCGPAPADPLMR